MVDYIKGMKFSSFFLLACGAVVRKSEAMAGLEAVARRYAPSGFICSLLTSLTGYSSPIPLLLVLSA